MPFLLNINFQAENVYTNTFDTESEAQNYATDFIKAQLEKVPKDSQAWANSVYSTVITPVENVLLPNYNL